MKRVEKFLKEEVCPTCHGTRLSEAARAPKVQGISLAEDLHHDLSALTKWVQAVPDSLPKDMVPMADSIVEPSNYGPNAILRLGRRLPHPRPLGRHPLDGRTAADAAGPGRPQSDDRRPLRPRRTVYRPSSVKYRRSHRRHERFGSRRKFSHPRRPRHTDFKRGRLDYRNGSESRRQWRPCVGRRNLTAIEENPVSQIGPFLSGKANTKIRPDVPQDQLFANGQIHLSTTAIHTVKPLDLTIPRGV